MKTKTLISAVTSLAVMTLFGCGGGGGAAPPAPPAGSTTITGAIVKGPINAAKITIFDVKADGTVDTANVLGTGDSKADGKYTITLTKTPSAGPMIVEAVGGTYTDEASGTKGVTLKATLRAAVPSVADGDSIAVTPLTEIAYHKTQGLQVEAVAGGTATTTGAGAFTATNITDSNLKIGKTFLVKDIIKSKPFDPTQAAPSTATADDKSYAAAVGIFSQLVNDDNNKQATKASQDDALLTYINKLEEEVHDHGGFLATTFLALRDASVTFKAKNIGGTMPAPEDLLLPKASVLTLTAQLPAAQLGTGVAINGLDFTITLPAGVQLKVDQFDAATGETAAGVVQPSSIAAVNSTVIGKYTPANSPAPATLRVVILNVNPGIVPTTQAVNGFLNEVMHINFDGFPTGTAGFTVIVNNANGGSNPAATPTPLTVTMPIDGNSLAGL